MHKTKRSTRKVVSRSAILGFVLALAASAGAQVTLDRPGGQISVNPQAYADQIQSEVAEIRGLEFKRSISVEHQSLDDFEVYLDAQLAKQMPEQRVKHFGKVVKKLGLYRGPEIEDLNAMIKMVMKSQAGAYYDPSTETFYVLMGDLPEMLMGGLYSHELYHGLQDQYFDLDRYVLSGAAEGLNDDELMARQAVVEGEATYIMTLWTMKSLLGSIPNPQMLEMTIRMQSEMDVDTLRSMLKSGAVADMMTDELSASIEAMDQIPPFMIESLIGAYLKGMAFVFEIQKQGWEKVEELYSNPPSSTEQILHPEKWLAGEDPFRLQWPDFEGDDLFGGWEVLDVNTVGEVQWRIIFAEYEMKNIAKAASAGWDGDTFAVLKRDGSDDLLLLLYTSWDSEAEAEEFAGAYRDLLEVKYPDGSEQVRVDVNGADVLILEGGEAGTADALLAFMKKTEKSK